jgi:hypothetical protein
MCIRRRLPPSGRVKLCCSLIKSNLSSFACSSFILSLSAIKLAIIQCSSLPPPPALHAPFSRLMQSKWPFEASGGDGSRVFVVEAPARGTIADLKRLLCLPPHSVCSDASALELVLKGEGAAVARAAAVCNAFDLHLTLWRAGCILRDDAALSSAAATPRA